MHLRRKEAKGEKERRNGAVYGSGFSEDSGEERPARRSGQVI